MVTTEGGWADEAIEGEIGSRVTDPGLSSRLPGYVLAEVLVLYASVASVLALSMSAKILMAVYWRLLQPGL